MSNRFSATESSLRLVKPRAIKRYATALGWVPVGEWKAGIEVYQHENYGSRQLLIPETSTFDDYADLIRNAVQRLADTEERLPSEVLSHLLLPAADVLRFSEKSVDAQAGSLNLPHAIKVLDGAYRMLLAQAHSQLNPQPFHPRMSRTDAEIFARHCRLGQTEHGSFTVTIACPLPSVASLFQDGDGPFARQVTVGIVESLNAVVRLADGQSLSEFEDQSRYPGLSANFFESLLMIRPELGLDWDCITFGVTWSKAFPPPPHVRSEVIRLDRECFEAAEHLAIALRRTPDSEVDNFVGFVRSLKGQTNEDGRVAGEVVFALMQQDESELVLARAELGADDYQIAGDAHLRGAAVACNAVLVRGARVGRLIGLTDLYEVQRPPSK